MNPTSLEIVASACFALALLHTFSVHRFLKIADRFPSGSVGENVFHLLGEVEIVFGFWAAIFLTWYALLQDLSSAIHYLEGLHFTEPIFVFVILSVCSARPILSVASWAVEKFSRLLPLKPALAFYFVALGIGPLLGSFITEPAAMTVLALILLNRFYSKAISPRFMYATLGLLFVNVSIGGVLTPYAAPPVLMVAGPWQWDLSFMLENFGWRGVLASLVSAAGTTFWFRKELAQLEWGPPPKASGLPLWVVGTHLIFLAAIVSFTHHPVVFVGIFLFFLGLVQVTKEYQDELKVREGLLVSFFLGGLVVLGGPQRWWLEPLLRALDPNSLFWGATALTALTDNAALTYLGAQVPDLPDLAKYALVAGAVTGGGLTVVANAPNPAGYGILNPAFGDGGIKPLGLLLGALPPTLVAAVCFWII